MPEHAIFLSLGTNLGDRRANLRQALAGLERFMTVLSPSPVYETPPWGLADQPAFLNMVIHGTTSLSPLVLLRALKKLEKRLGRLPSVRFGPRLIDMDILFYEDLVLNSVELTLPHPRLQERAFVLVPLNDLAPDLVHPVLGKTVRALLAATDTKGIFRYD
jgi:2-amino-4-hydroxy-6-hydroxymethyldihydropteridine diphosphokinase